MWNFIVKPKYCKTVGSHIKHDYDLYMASLPMFYDCILSLIMVEI